MPAFTNASSDRTGCRSVDVSFTRARLVPAEGGLQYEELWLLGGADSADDWNNWVVAIRMLHVGRVPWIFHRIVPWWGEYLHANRTA